MDLSFLPPINALLNATAATLLVTGLVLIRRGRQRAHTRCMISAFFVSCLFLVLYVTHQAWRVQATGHAHTSYNGPQALRIFYYSMLISHVLLAMLVPLLALAMIYLGWRGRFGPHRRLGRVALPIWLYVSVTGVLIYLMLYQLNQPAP